MLNVQLDTDKFISGTLFRANPLASTDKKVKLTYLLIYLNSGDRTGLLGLKRKFDLIQLK